LPTILDQILAHKRGEVEQARSARPLGQLKSLPGYLLPRRNFYGAVTVPRRGRLNLIAEIKRASPSAGVLRPDFDPAALARGFAAGGAQALSVLTDERYFGGHIEHIALVKAAVDLPVLRKDFLVDPYQVHESRAYAADAVLVIAEALGAGPAVELAELARSLELWVLLEAHTRASLLEVLPLVRARLQDGVLLGINNRDLHAQQTDLATTEELAPLIPPGWPIVAESGIQTRKDVERMHAAGARALLVGEALLRAPDPERAVRELFG
jgi:indole-3-glycerol phosphate synthase